VGDGGGDGAHWVAGHSDQWQFLESESGKSCDAVIR
jgi:hypothetical protein